MGTSRFFAVLLTALSACGPSPTEVDVAPPEPLPDLAILTFYAPDSAIAGERVLPSTEYRLPGDLPNYPYHVLLVLDATNLIQESDEGNNVASRPMTVRK
jgi:hypothetical protein